MRPKSTSEIPPEILNRKGSRDTAGVPRAVRELLDAGRIETVNLSEWLVVDQERLAMAVLPGLGMAAILPAIRAGLRALEKPTAPKRSALIGRVLVDGASTPAAVDRGVGLLLGSASDVVRSWACYWVGLNPAFTLAEKLDRMRVPAADRNMGVRETAWSAVRENLAEDLEGGIRRLTSWTSDPDPNVRRFASEATRPRGVWCRHIPALKNAPEQGLPILEPLRSDTSKYVRDSVGNWLNDASKSAPGWVRAVAGRWVEESPTRETAYVVKRALRTIGPG